MKRISDFYALKNGSWSAKVSPGSGGNIIELKNGNETILRPLLYEEEKTIDPFRHGAAILLPSNRTDKAAFEYKGEKYSLPVTNPQTGMNLHGGINQQKFTVVHSDASSVCLEMQSTPEIYPFEFSLQVLYRLKTDGCHATYTLSNQSCREMPYTFGIHATFADVRLIQIQLGKRFELDDRKLPTGRMLVLSPMEEAFKTGEPVPDSFSGFFTAESHTMQLNRKTIFSVSANFDQWILFRPKGERMFCVEPQSGSVNGLNMSEPHYKVLLPGESVEYSWMITEVCSGMPLKKEVLL